MQNIIKFSLVILFVLITSVSFAKEEYIKLTEQDLLLSQNSLRHALDQIKPKEKIKWENKKTGRYGWAMWNGEERGTCKGFFMMIHTDKDYEGWGVACVIDGYWKIMNFVDSHGRELMPQEDE